MIEGAKVELQLIGGPGADEAELRLLAARGSPRSESKYLLGDLLHEGASSVFLAHHRHLDREVVVKRYASLPMDSARARAQLARVGALSHSHTARILDVGASPGPRGGVFVVREYFAGQTLAQILQSGFRFDGAGLVSLATQVLKSLGDAHARGLVHGSLCPEHILVVGEGDETYVEVLDYESCALGLPLGPHAAAYAPGGQEPSRRADLQALALVLRAASTGQGSSERVFDRVLRGEIEDAGTFELALRSECGAPMEQSADPLLSFGHHELLAEQPEMLWVFSDGPGTSSGALASVWEQMRSRAEVRYLDADARSQALEELRTGATAPPWLVVFSDLHVLLSDPLLDCLRQTGEVGRMLVSTHANYELLETTVNGGGLDRQVCLPADPRAIVEDVVGSIEIVRRRREHYDELRRRIRRERARVEALVRSLAQTGRGW